MAHHNESTAPSSSPAASSSASPAPSGSSAPGTGASTGAESGSASAPASAPTPGSPASSGADQARAERVTLRTIRRMVDAGERFACLTCYDATMAGWLERSGLPMILVGDTAAEMIEGFDQTYYADMDFMVRLTAGVRRGASRVCLMADMPFMSYQASDAEAMHNAARFMKEAGADLIKLEVDRADAPLIEKMARAGVPVVAHIGSRPQQTKISGGYRSSGRTIEEARRLVADARALEAAGAVMLLVEATPAEVAQQIVEGSKIPVIGCGAGPACHGQVIVLYDLLGLTGWQPRFARPAVRLGEQMQQAASEWIDRVARNDLGEHPYRMSSPASHPGGAAESGPPDRSASAPSAASTPSSPMSASSSSPADSSAEVRSSGRPVGASAPSGPPKCR